MSIVSVLEGLCTLPDLCNITFNTLLQYGRLVSHLKNDILLPQPPDQSNINNPPEILPPTIATFLSFALDIPTEHMQDGLDVLKDYLWNCAKVPLLDEDYEAFKVFGWELGLTAYTLYPPNMSCLDNSCENIRLLKKEKARRAVVYTFSNGAQPAWAVDLYCPAFPIAIYRLRTPKNDLEAPRYQIDFRGLSTYNTITDADKSIIQGMINCSKQGVFATHSRSYGIVALKWMLPVLARDEASANWYEEENPTPTAGPSRNRHCPAVPAPPGRRPSMSS